MDFLKNNRLALHLIMGVLLTIIYPMQELFSGNQNIYFLWGMSDLLPNAFTADPLLNSPDPYPLFSWLISIFPVQFLAVWTSFMYILLNAVYSFSLFGIANQLARIYSQKSRLFSFLTLFFFLHASPIWGTYFKLIANVDLRWIWDSGIAEQGVLRGYLQPSVFGVFLLLSFYFASRRNFAAAILSIAPAAAIHANYLFLGGILTVIYLIQARFERRSIIASALLLLMVLPYSIYLLNHFLLLDADTKNTINQAVMAGYDSNIHINPSNWINAKFFLQLGVLLIGLVTIWNTRLRTLFLSILGIAITLTAIAYATDNTTLISLNPWRFSILLVPISVVAILSKIIESGLWNSLRPTSIAVIGSVCVMLVYYRVFGTGTDAFHNQWLMIHFALTVGIIAIVNLLAKREWFSKLLEPLLVFALLVVGTTDIFVERSTKENAVQFKAITNLKGSEPNTIYIIPPDWTSFRMNAEKGVFVDENLVYGPALPSLMQRLEEVERATKTSNYSEVISSVSPVMTIKLIAPREQQIEGVVSSENITENYVCYVLR